MSRTEAETNHPNATISSNAGERGEEAGAGTQPGTIIQLGSGHPGEDGSHDFERALLKDIVGNASRILFFPFHPMPPHSGDMARFEQIHFRGRPGIGDVVEGIQLRPPSIPEALAELGEKIRSASVIVLGSGFPEPYIRLFRRTGLDRALREAHAAGTAIIGYSAGTLAISEGYYRPFTGRDLLVQLDLLDHISLHDRQRREIEQSLRRALKRPDAEAYIDALRSRIEGDLPLTPDDHVFLDNMLWMESAEGFRLNPGLTVNPHFGSRLHYALDHLILLGTIKPDWIHVGLPNGCAVVTRWEAGMPRRCFRGHHPAHEAYMLRDGTSPVRLSEGDRIPPGEWHSSSGGSSATSPDDAASSASSFDEGTPMQEREPNR